MHAQDNQLWRRQNGGVDDGSGEYYGDDYGGFWWSPAGMAVRYAIVALLFISVLLYFVLGRAHAQRRLSKGLEPLPYHRWMVRRQYQASYPRYASHAPQYQSETGHGYPMETYAPPPPAYSSAYAPPPVYQPPEGSSKIMADQNYPHVHAQSDAAGEGSSEVAPPQAVARAA